MTRRSCISIRPLIMQTGARRQHLSTPPMSPPDIYHTPDVHPLKYCLRVLLCNSTPSTLSVTQVKCHCLPPPISRIWIPTRRLMYKATIEVSLNIRIAILCVEVKDAISMLLIQVMTACGGRRFDVLTAGMYWFSAILCTTAIIHATCLCSFSFHDYIM